MITDSLLKERQGGRCADNRMSDDVGRTSGQRAAGPRGGGGLP